MTKKIICFNKLILLILYLFFFSFQVMALTTYEAQIIKLENETEVILPHQETPQKTQAWKLRITSSQRRDEEVMITLTSNAYLEIPSYKPGERVLIAQNEETGMNDFYIMDYLRRPALIWLTALFVIVALFIGRTQSFKAILSLIGSFLIIFSFILPRIANGSNPILIVIIGSCLIVPLIFLLSHGFKYHTIIAMFASLLTLIITGFLILIFTHWGKLTGLASEEAGFIQAMSGNLINLKNLLIAGMLIATLGVLDDITIAQTGIVKQLKQANQQLSLLELYQKAMTVGRDHIASMINTLILVYAGASFPLLLLFLDSGQSLPTLLNYEIIAEEIIRTLTGSLGLILAVPLTTFLASYYECRIKN